jgi:hypothetical protein
MTALVWTTKKIGHGVTVDRVDLFSDHEGAKIAADLVAPYNEDEGARVVEVDSTARCYVKVDIVDVTDHRS